MTRRKTKPKRAATWQGQDHCKFYDELRWQKKRSRQLTLMPLCEYHARLSQYVPATVADHVIPHKCDATLFWQGKLQSLCYDCHASVKRKLEKARERCLKEQHPQPCSYDECVRKLIGYSAKGFPAYTDSEIPAEFLKLMQDNAAAMGWTVQ